jgi:hypothetical protein
MILTSLNLKALFCVAIKSVHIHFLQDYFLECCQLQVNTLAPFTVNFLDSGEVSNVVVKILTLLLLTRKFLSLDLSLETSYSD